MDIRDFEALDLTLAVSKQLKCKYFMHSCFYDKGVISQGTKILHGIIYTISHGPKMLHGRFNRKSLNFDHLRINIKS